MKLSLFDYNLPKELIAQKPRAKRDSSRLLVYSPTNKRLIHDYFHNLPKYFTMNDLLVFNNSKVFPARLLGQKETGGKCEVLLLKNIKGSTWEVLLGINRPKIGLNLLFSEGLKAKILNTCSDKTWLIEFNFKASKCQTIFDKIGQVPLPPYIHSNTSEKNLKQQYQTVYAKPIGSAAAPTAGLHFTKELIGQIKKMGCAIEFVTLHVGLGTFDPVKTDNIEDYKIHSEWISISQKTINNIIQAKKDGKRIIAVGTTSVRVLETIFDKKITKSFSGNINTFIYPGYKFKIVDAIITNFHLPKSSLLMLVSAFIGRKNVMKIYQTAIKLKYRFFSFGDAMFLMK